MNTNHRNGRTSSTENLLETLTAGYCLKIAPIHIRCNFANTQWILLKLKLERLLFGLSRKMLSIMVLECYRSPKSENVDYFKNWKFKQWWSFREFWQVTKQAFPSFLCSLGQYFRIINRFVCTFCCDSAFSTSENLNILEFFIISFWFKKEKFFFVLGLEVIHKQNN